MKKSVEKDHSQEVVDPISGEITTHSPPHRYRRRDEFLDDLGREIPDPRPMQPPLGYKKQPSMFELMREAVAREVALYAANREPESFEESEDFDIPDDPVDPHSPWENDFDPPFSEVRQAIEEARAAKANSDTGKPLASGGDPRSGGALQPQSPPVASPLSPKPEGNPQD